MPRKKAEGDEQIEVIDRIDPSEEAAIDGDPSFNFRLKQDGLPEDKVAVWVHRDAVRTYKGRRWTEARVGEVDLMAGAPADDGAPIQEEDHTLMVRDRAYHERSIENERKANRDLRRKFIKDSNKTIYVNAPGDGPRAMDRR